MEPFQGDATVMVSAQEPPEELGRRAPSSARVEHQLRVEGIYTFFYQEKEQGFLFSGESHPMTELTYVDQGALHTGRIFCSSRGILSSTARISGTCSTPTLALPPGS